MKPFRHRPHFYVLCLLLSALMATDRALAQEQTFALNLYAAKLTSNNWEEFFTDSEQLDFVASKLFVISLAKQVATYRQMIDYEIEGQLAKHNGIQQHWELNGLGAVRWNPFWWDRFLETSAAFGLGLSYASEKPRAEIRSEGSTEPWMLYWMMEVAFSLPQWPEVALISRIHHRSEGYGLLADEGGSNALAIGLKYRF